MFDPNTITLPNGNYFGFSHRPEEARLVLMSVPWDVTTSYRPGTAQGPAAICEASTQLDFFDFDIPQAWTLPIATLPTDPSLEAENRRLRKLSEKIIAQLEKGENASEDDLQNINNACANLHQKVYQQSLQQLQQGKIVGLVGGDHSCPLGLLQALAQQEPAFGILHFDAHADLRQAYEGFTYSHASIMFNALKIDAVKKIVQLGIRDLCPEEHLRASQDPRIVQFNDYRLKENEFLGINWHQQCQEILHELPKKVYLSFDIDALSPELCPHTGTPVAGGLSFHQAIYLLRLLKESGREIIGFDLSEVAPGHDEWDANVGARILYKLACYAAAPTLLSKH